MNKKSILLILLLALMTGAANVFAAEVSYDRYASLYADRKQPSSISKVSTEFLTYPFELVRWPVDQALIFTEKQHLLNKGKHIYDKFVDNGVTPLVGFQRYGAEVDFLRATRQKVRFPDYTLKGWYDSYESSMFAGVRTGMERIMDTPLRVFGTLDYSSREEEHFYGIGPDTSKGEGTSFKMEQTKLEATVGYSKDPSFSADLNFYYKNTNITNGEDGGRGIIDTTFPNTAFTIPGLKGDEMIGTGIDLVRDTRDHKDASTRGYLARFAYSFNEGLGYSDARYLKAILEYSHYFRLWSDRRIFVTHFYFEDNHALAGRQVPFWDMARLGGYGNHPSLSQTLRGYDNNRFFDRDAALMNLEYRYTVYEYRDFKADTVLFWDTGQTFRKVSQMQFGDFNCTYGGGVRLSLLEHVIASIEVAHGNEGTGIYVKNRAPF